MKKGWLQKLTLLVSQAFLFSCGKVAFANPEAGVSLFYNGEAYLNKGNSIEEYCYLEKNLDIVSKVNSGEAVFLIVAAKDCAHCQKLLPVLYEVLKSYPLEIHLCEQETMSEPTQKKALDAILSFAFPLLPETKSSYPYGYFIKSPTQMESFSFSGHYASASDLTDFLSEKIYLNNVYRFEKETGFATFLNENSTVGYIYNSASSKAFIEHELPEIKTKKKSVGLFSSSAYEEGYYKMDNGLQKITKEDALGIL